MNVGRTERRRNKIVRKEEYCTALRHIGLLDNERMFVLYSLLFKNALSLSDADRASALATTLASLEPFEIINKRREGTDE